MTKITWLIISLFRKNQNFSSRSYIDLSHHFIYFLFNIFFQLWQSSLSCIILDNQMRYVDQKRLFQKFLMFLSRKNFNKLVYRHFRNRYSVNIDSFNLNFLSQLMSMNINMFQLRIKLQHFLIQNSENLTIITQNMQLFHEIKSNWFEESSSSDNLLCDSK